ncbi:AAA family ATPase, partial [Devosia sp.]|uniref:AAA family ATPase n=1 Tax=Devosia sp. TaxID=1871048 RepID=UPI002736A1C1
MLVSEWISRWVSKSLRKSLVRTAPGDDAGQEGEENPSCIMFAICSILDQLIAHAARDVRARLWAVHQHPFFAPKVGRSCTMSTPGTSSLQSEGTPIHNSSIGRRLALEMLDNLRRRTADRLAQDAGSEEDAVAIAEKLQANMRLPVDRAAYTIALAYCLAPHFATMKSLVATQAFVVIRTRNGDDAATVGDVLADAVVLKSGRVNHNPRYGLGQGDSFVILADAGGRHDRISVRIIAQAAEQRLPIFGTMSADDPTPDALAGADLELQLPPMSPEMLAVLFEAAHDEVPGGVLSFSSAEKLRTENLVAHVRRGRTATECLSGLQQAVNPQIALPHAQTDLLGDLHGYGAAKTWGLELAQDFELWRKGRLTWDEVDHRAVVLSGPPGTGKTSFAAVLAATLKVPLIATSVAEWNARDNLSGTLKRMQAVFEQAVAQAPSVLFIDELDGIASRDTLEGRYSEYWTQIVNRMLELVTNAMGTAGVVIVGATNHVDRIDPALTRSGRLDEIIRIELPDAEAIAHILARYAGFDVSRQELSGLAERLVGQSGADIEKLVRAAKAAARRAGLAFTVNELHAQVPDPDEALSPQMRRRVQVYRTGQRIVAQVLGLAEMA